MFYISIIKNVKVQARGNRLLFLGGVVHVGQATLAAVLPVKVGSHKDTGTTLFTGALSPQTIDLAVVIHPVVLQHGELDLAVLVFLLLGCGVVLLLSFLGTSSEPQNQVKGRFGKIFRPIKLSIKLAQGTK